MTGGVDVVGGTTWLWASKTMADSVDVLFVDEAGQMALANTLAIAGSAASMVLLGDPQQLEQPIKGSHPPGADASALQHLLGDSQTIAEDLRLVPGTDMAAPSGHLHVHVGDVL